MTPFLTRRSLCLEVCHLPRPLSGVWFCTSLGISPTNCKVHCFFFWWGGLAEKSMKDNRHKFIKSLHKYSLYIHVPNIDMRSFMTLVWDDELYMLMKPHIQSKVGANSMPCPCFGIDIIYIVLVFSLWEKPTRRGIPMMYFLLRNTLRVFNVCIYTTNILHKFNLKMIMMSKFPICFRRSTWIPVKLMILLMEEIPSNHPGCVKPWEKKRDKLPTSTGFLAGFLNHQRYGNMKQPTHRTTGQVGGMWCGWFGP